MFEKVNPQHPDKVADQIAGAIVDLAYEQANNPRIAVEAMLGHGQCNIIIETSQYITAALTQRIVKRIAGAMPTYTHVVQQDEHLSRNQDGAIRCGDNGIFRGCPITKEQLTLCKIAKRLYGDYPTDGKFIIDGQRLIICQSNMPKEEHPALLEWLHEYGIEECIINPIGFWTGGLDVDTGCTNRKLGSDMGNAVTGGGLHGKDLSKADVSVNVLCHKLAQQHQKVVEACTAIGDTSVSFRFEDGVTVAVMPYEDVVAEARKYIKEKYGSFEVFARWGLVTAIK